MYEYFNFSVEWIWIFVKSPKALCILQSLCFLFSTQSPVSHYLPIPKNNKSQTNMVCEFNWWVIGHTSYLYTLFRWNLTINIHHTIAIHKVRSILSLAYFLINSHVLPDVEINVNCSSLRYWFSCDGLLITTIARLLHPKFALKNKKNN